MIYIQRFTGVKKVTWSRKIRDGIRGSRRFGQYFSIQLYIDIEKGYEPIVRGHRRVFTGFRNGSYMGFKQLRRVVGWGGKNVKPL